MQHQSRFKHYLIDPANLSQEAKLLAPQTGRVHSLLLEQKIHPAEACLQVLFIYLQARHPDQWKMKSPTEKYKSFNLGNLWDFVHSYRIKHLSENIIDVLCRWRAGQYSILLYENIIAPLELLRLQAEGKRIITLNFACAEIGELVDGRRDAFEFMLHDLTHADLFFKDPELYQQQKQFFARLQNFLQIGSGADLLGLSQDPAMVYLMSDMNSHAAHMELQLEAALIQYFLRLEGKAEKETLSLDAKNKVDNLLSSFL